MSERAAKDCDFPRGDCVSCGRPMVRRVAFLVDPVWARHGFVGFQAFERCSSCYTRFKNHREGPVDPHLRRVEPQDERDPDDLCSACDIPVDDHRLRPLSERELLTLRRMVGVA